MSLAAVLAAVIAADAGAQPVAQVCPTNVGPVSCRTVDVPERPGSRKMIKLDLVVLKPTGQKSAPDPLFVLQGGPGQSASRQADFYARTFADLRQERDIYLIDVRGTGASAPLQCNLAKGNRSDLLPLDAIRLCRQTLAAKADLTTYTTTQISHDLEQVRRALHLPPINIYGTSYGSRLALEYMKMYPQSVRTAALSGVLPAQNDAPASYGRFAQDVFDKHVVNCRTTPECAARFPDPARMLSDARRAVEAAHRADPASVSPGLFGELVRMELYAPRRVPQLFGNLAAAASGDLKFWNDRADRLTSVWGPEGLSLGMFLSVTCADFMPRIDAAQVRKAAAGTFAGSYRAEQQAAACALWRVPRAPASFARPAAAATPTLLLSGEYDPVTPPAWGAVAARTLPNGRTVIIRNNGHSIGPAGRCVASMIGTLLKTASVRAIDDSCADDLTPPDFTPRKERASGE